MQLGSSYISIRCWKSAFTVLLIVNANLFLLNLYVFPNLLTTVRRHTITSVMDSNRSCDMPVKGDETSDVGFTVSQLKRDISVCSKEPPGLVGPVPPDEHVTELDILENRYFPSKPGGHFKPYQCQSRTKTAIIIAYRNRKNHLLVLLNNLIPFLIKQQAEFSIFVVEPVPSLTFNRGLLMNVGFTEALKTNNFTCIVLHDVDLIPVNDRNLYRCGNNPRHMAGANSKFGYRLPYRDYAGGVISMSRAIYEKINGMSNLYFGWGAEDDDLLYRLRYKKYKLLRYPMNIGRYIALGHGKDEGNKRNPGRKKLLSIKVQTPKSAAFEGLNSLKYKIVDLQTMPLYTWILIDIDMAYYRKSLSYIFEHN